MGLFRARQPYVRFRRRQHGRVIEVGGALSKAERAKLRRLLAPLPIHQGEISIHTDRLGRTRLVFADIPERYHQPVRNLIGNLSRL